MLTDAWAWRMEHPAGYPKAARVLADGAGAIGPASIAASVTQG